MDQPGSKDSSRDLQLNCVISFCFRLYLMFHACVTRFDVTRNLVNFFGFQGELNKALFVALIVDDQLSYQIFKSYSCPESGSTQVARTDDFKRQNHHITKEIKLRKRDGNNGIE